MKLPKPACPKSGTRQPENLYTESQMRQAIRDALEEAAKVCENMERNGAWITKLESSTAIRKLKEQINASNQ